MRRMALAVGAVVLCAALLIGGANAYVLLSSSGEATSRLAQVPDAEVALVLGAYVEPDGRMSQMLADRVQGALELWRRPQGGQDPRLRRPHHLGL